MPNKPYSTHSLSLDRRAAAMSRSSDKSTMASLILAPDPLRTLQFLAHKSTSFYTPQALAEIESRTTNIQSSPTTHNNLSPPSGA
mmetsp:Transcript_20470/g.33379  ORF Transcript_20470/g.33379 Transcript_20470/m.33379 type:complete len:85 (+) Transcript_20470:2001-2255(+)